MKRRYIYTFRQGAHLNSQGKLQEISVLSGVWLILSLLFSKGAWFMPLPIMLVILLCRRRIVCPPVLILTDSYGSQVMGHRFDGSEPSGVTHRPFVEIHNGKSAAIQCLSPSQVRQIDKIVSRLMVEELRFLQPRYSLRSLSEDSGVPVYQLSLFMNKYYQISYNDFINRQRVAYCEKKISAGECNMKTLEALASESGFNNRTSFTQSFKRFTGLTPSAYLREAQAGSLKSTGSSEQSLANRFVDVVIA